MSPKAGSGKAVMFSRVAVALGVGLAALLLGAAGTFETAELKLFDLRLRVRGEHPAHPAVAIVTMDEATNQQLGGDWRKRRIYHGELARALAFFGARLTAFDVVLVGPNEDDAEVAAAFAGAANVYLAYYFSFDTYRAPWDPAEVEAVHGLLEHDPETTLAEVAAHLERDPGLVRSAYEHAQGLFFLRERSLPVEAPATIWTAADATAPSLPLFLNARGVGFTQLDPDEDHRGLNRDGVARKYPLFMRMGERLYPSMALALALDYWGVDPGELRLTPGHDLRIPLPGSAPAEGGPVPGPTPASEGSPAVIVPVDHEGEAIINWAGGWSSGLVFPRYSYWEIIDSYYMAVNGLETTIPEEELSRLEETIVLVGDTTLDTPDRRAVPFESWYPMVGFQANALGGLLAGDFLRRWGKLEETLAVLGLALILGITVPRMRPLWSTSWMLVLLVLLAGAGQWLLSSRSLWINLLTPGAGLVLAHLSLLLVGFEAERREKRRVRQAFGHYVAPSVVNEVLRDPEGLRLGGDQREVTILFSDVRDFTTMSEGMGPEGLVALLNEYLTAMTRVVYRHQGTLDKFVGDAIMAVYGAPVRYTNHAERACRTAVEMMDALHELCRKWEAEGRKTLNIGIGLNTGQVVAGNVGSEERMDYTVMGDTVNVASRLEGANKQFGTNIIISQATYEEVKDLAEVRPLGSIKVKGRGKEIMVYELLGMRAAG